MLSYLTLLSPSYHSALGQLGTILKLMAKDNSETTYAADLLDFWYEIMKGKMLVSDSHGQIKESFVPIEIRLRASELLAKYTVTAKGKAVEDHEVSATPDILRVAQMLESDDRYTDEDIRRALAVLPQGES